METSNFYAFSPKPRLTRPVLPYNGTVSYTRDFCNLACSSVNPSGVLHHLSSPLMKQNKLVSTSSCGTEKQIYGFSNELRCKLEAGKLLVDPRRRASYSRSLKPCLVKSDNSEGSLSGESILLNEQTLERELQIAIEEENYAQAAKIRDSLRVLQEDTKASVLAANARFYNSFRKGDLAAMQALWAKGENVCVVHPGVSGISGYDLVMGSWEFVWAEYEFPLEIETKDVQVHVRGDLGYVTCIEMVKTKGSSWGKQFATNVFERIDGQWFICIHHASYIDL